MPAAISMLIPVTLSVLAYKSTYIAYPSILMLNHLSVLDVIHVNKVIDIKSLFDRKEINTNPIFVYTLTL